MADQLYALPAREARLIEATAAPPAIAALGRLDDQATRLALVLALVLAGVVLLAVLARVLRAPEEAA